MADIVVLVVQRGILSCPDQTPLQSIRTQSTSVSLSAPPTPQCLPSLVSQSPPASPWPPGGTPPDPPPPPCSTPPGPSRTLTPLPSSLEPEPPPSESLDLELVLDPSLDLSSLDTPGIPL